MNARSYLLRTLIISLVAALLVLGFNALVDPYGIVGTPRIPYLNQYKVDINAHARVLKKYQPFLGTYNALIVGNSRVELGINPSHHCFKSNGVRAYNLGIPGADVPTQLANALNVTYAQPIESIFLSVDFTDFIFPDALGDRRGVGSIESAMAEFRYDLAGNPNPRYPYVYFLDYVRSLFSLDALIASLKTIALQGQSAADRDDAGFNPARDFAEAVRIEGPHALFEQKMIELQKKYSGPWFVRDAHQRLNPAFDDLETFLRITTARGIRVYLFTNPFHEQFWQLMRSQGHMSLYEDWLMSVQDVASKSSGGAVVFWDFAADSPYIHEHVPGNGVKSGPLRWFWEPAHYRRQLGDLMVNAMLADSCGTDVELGHRIF